jgi:hypothetical protein
MRRLASAVAVLAFLPMFAACADEVRPESHTVIAMDLTGSFDGAARDDYLKAQVSAALNRIKGSGTVEVIGFSSELGTSTCIPPKATITWAGNTAKWQAEKQNAGSQLMALLPAYFDCANKAVTKKSSDVLGAIAEAHSQVVGSPGDHTLVVISDGCQTTYAVKTCKNKQMVDPTWRQKTLQALPESLRPNLADTDLVFVGLAVNSKMEQTAVDGLRSFYKEFAELTKARSLIIV